MIIALIARSSFLARLNRYWYTTRRVRWSRPTPMALVVSRTCPSAKWLPLVLKCSARSYGVFAALEPTMKENPASSSASRLAADSIPASATTTMSLTSWASWNALSTGMRVLVSALLPSNRCTANGNPPGSHSSPTVTWGSTRRSLDIPTLRSESSFGVSKCSVVRSYSTAPRRPVGAAWA